MANNNDLLIVENLTMTFKGAKRFLEKKKPDVVAVNNVSFTVKEGETFGLVGESGCGKTTLGKCVVRLLNPTKGKLMYNDDGEWKDLLKLSKEESFALREKLPSLMKSRELQIQEIQLNFR